jgi:hypothetical protein
MNVGIGLPNSLLDVEGPELVTWAQRSEQHGFSVLSTIGRIAYGSHEELIALAAAAGATQATRTQRRPGRPHRRCGRRLPRVRPARSHAGVIGPARMKGDGLHHAVRRTRVLMPR